MIDTIKIVEAKQEMREGLEIVKRYIELKNRVEIIQGWVVEEITTKVGTKYEVFQEVCSKCGGTGQLPEYGHVDNGVCFKCAGSGKGKLRKKLKVLDNAQIKAIEDKLKATEDKREQQFRDEAYTRSLKDRKKWFKFYDSDELIIAQGDTYNNKEKLKEHGFMWQQWLRSWVSNKPNNKPALKGVKYKTISIWDICFVNEYNVVVDCMDAINEIAGYR